MTDLDRALLSPWWCSHHWQPYASDKDAAERAADAMAHALMQKPDLARAVQNRQEKYSVGVSRAARAVIEDWVGRTDKPVCCLLGDEAMERILMSVSTSESSQCP